MPILPAAASATGNYRGICDWADRPLTFNAIGDTLRISDQALLEFVWDGSAWATADPAVFVPAVPGPIGGTTPAAGSFTTLSATGVAKFADGTAAVPSVTFTDDPDTGIISSAADALGLVTGGVERWIVDASGALNPVADNTYDIGGATKPRDISAGRAVTGLNLISTAAAPASAAAAGTAGEIRSADGFIYICVATGNWQRAAVATWA